MRISREVCAGDTGTYTLQEAAEIFERRSRIERKIRRRTRNKRLRYYRIAALTVLLGVIAALVLDDDQSAGIVLCAMGTAIAFGAGKGDLS